MEKLLTVKDTAQMLNVSVSTIYKWVDERRIPHIDLGDDGRRRCLRFKPKALKGMIDNRSKF